VKCEAGKAAGRGHGVPMGIFTSRCWRWQRHRIASMLPCGRGWWWGERGARDCTSGVTDRSQFSALR
jgi:hypothetical protein